jgi:polysaccharide export outer membrane protein
MPMTKSYLILYVFIYLMLFSCTNTRKATYFNNLKDTVILNEVPTDVQIIQNNDLLSISVSSLNPDAALIFNIPNRSNVQASSATGNLIQPAGYLVDEDGNIRFPILGNVAAAGLSKQQLNDNLRTALIERKLLLDPIIDIRYLNYKVTVLGEVARPTVISVPNERITLLEALGLAGDLTIYAKRDNVLLIRDEAGKKVTRRINLNSNELLTSPYYYLKSNDVIYVEPNKTRVASTSRVNLYLPAIIGGLSTTIIILLDRLTR